MRSTCYYTIPKYKNHVAFEVIYILSWERWTGHLMMVHVASLTNTIANLFIPVDSKLIITFDLFTLLRGIVIFCDPTINVFLC